MEMPTHVEAAYAQHVERLAQMEERYPLGDQQLRRISKLVRRADEKELMHKPLKEVLEKFPAFRANFDDCDPRRREELTRWWGTADARLLPLLKACADLGNFDFYVDAPGAATEAAKAPASLRLNSWSPF